MPQPYSIGSPFIELQSVDSTNNYALANVRAGTAQHGMAWFSHEQVAGKGQRGKTWTAEKDSSLILSVAVRPGPLLVTQQFQLSACIATAVCSFFSTYAGDECRIKWPNDLYWHDRKAGGILIENIIRTGASEILTGISTAPTKADGAWQWAIVGTGININQPSFHPTIQHAVSLLQITGKKHDPLLLAKDLCASIDQYFNQLMNGGFETIYQQYLTLLYKRNQTVTLKRDNRIFNATIKSVTKTGQLVIKHAIEESIEWGEVSFVAE